MDILKPFIKHFSYDFYTRRDGLNVKKHLRDLNRTQYYTHDRIAERQLEMLKNILHHAYRNNKFYAGRFDAIGFKPEDFRSADQLSGLPLLTKDDIRGAGDELFSKGFDRSNTVHKRTGGSTGVPLHNFTDIEASSIKKAAAMRHNQWAHLVPGDHLAAVWGDTTKKPPLKARIRNALMERAFYLDTLKFDDDRILPFLGNIRRYKPPVMMGHAHSIFRLAEYVREHKIEGIRFEGIITTAMVLSPEERKTIEEVLESPVFNRYGCEELSIIASECEAHEGLHIFVEGLYVEVLGGDRNRPGKLVITDLLNRAMPMIRYEIGDYGILAEGSCSCGRALPRLTEVAGRTADFLYTSEKKPVFGISILDTFVIHIPGFKQVQIVQDRYDHLDFHIIKDPADFGDGSIRLLKENVREIFGENMTYDVHYVDKIKQTERGKFRFSICNIEDKEM